MDIARAGPEEVHGMLLSFGIPPDEMVSCIWLSGRARIALCYVDFVAYYDDLWYPSSDDVLVTDRAFFMVAHLSGAGLGSFLDFMFLDRWLGPNRCFGTLAYSGRW